MRKEQNGTAVLSKKKTAKAKAAPKIRLKGRRLAIVVELPERTSEGGVVLPEANMTKTNKGVIAFIGDGCEDAWQEGSVVAFEPYAGSEFRIDGRDFLILNEVDIIYVQN